MKTKLLISTGLFLLIMNSLAFSQKKDAVVRYIVAKSDKNIVPDKAVGFADSKSDMCYIVDGNESKGYIEIVFEGVNASKTPQTITLIFNSADVEYAESAHGFSVFLDAQKLGTITQVNRNAQLEVVLDVSQLKSSSSFSLTIKANGDDGLYLLSVKSGFGPVLMITY